MHEQSDRDRAVYRHIWSTEGERAPSDTFRRMIEIALDGRSHQHESVAVADLGSGSGRHAKYASRNGCSVVAVEYDETGIARQRRIPGRDWAIVDADVRTWLPTQHDNSFDAIVCFDALHHMVQDADTLMGILDEIRRVARDGGLLLLTLLCEIEYSAGIVPRDRLNMNEDQARAAFENAFRNDEVLVLKSKPVLVKRTHTAGVDGTIIEASYRSRRVLTLVRLGG